MSATGSGVARAPRALRLAGISASALVGVAGLAGGAAWPARFEPLVVVLLGAVALVAVAAFAACARAALTPRVALAGLATVALQALALLAREPVAVALAAALSFAPAVLAARRPGLARLVRRAALAQLAGLLAWALLSRGGGHGLAGALAAVALALAAAARLGAFPLHGWLAPAVSELPLPVLLPTVASPVPVLALVRFGAPALLAHGRVAEAAVALGLLGAAYGAVVAIDGDDLLRVLGFALVSQQGLALAGLFAGNAESVAGGAAHALVASVAGAGLLALAHGVVARTGTASLARLRGLGQRAPHLAAAFLLLVLGATGFPGTASFVSEDLLAQGLLHANLARAVALLAALALQGIALYRVYKRVFLGPADDSSRGFAELLPRERLAWTLLAGALLLGGFVAGPLLAIEVGVARALPSARTHDAHAAHTP